MVGPFYQVDHSSACTCTGECEDDGGFPCSFWTRFDGCTGTTGKFCDTDTGTTCNHHDGSNWKYACQSLRTDHDQWLQTVASVAAACPVSSEKMGLALFLPEHQNTLDAVCAEWQQAGSACAAEIAKHADFAKHFALACHNNDCLDNGLFSDRYGQPCWEWRGYDCTAAGEDWNYTLTEVSDLLSNCKHSCNVCPTGTDVPRGDDKRLVTWTADAATAEVDTCAGKTRTGTCIITCAGGAKAGWCDAKSGWKESKDMLRDCQQVVTYFVRL